MTAYAGFVTDEVHPGRCTGLDWFIVGEIAQAGGLHVPILSPDLMNAETRSQKRSDCLGDGQRLGFTIKKVVNDKTMRDCFVGFAGQDPVTKRRILPQREAVLSLPEDHTLRGK